MDVDAYLERIGYTASTAPTAAVLAGLHEAHLETVPFENFSIVWNEPIVLDIDLLFDKIVRRRRGGFCYELNGMFAALLDALGFRVSMIAAGVAHPGGGFGPDFDHMALIVTLDERWLADVGFGDSFRLPLLLDERGAQNDGWRDFRVSAAGEDRFLERQEAGGSWQFQYRFAETPRSLDEYVPMCEYHQTSPESHFTTRRVASLATRTGRITLSDEKLVTTDRAGGKLERSISGDDEVASVLRDTFGIERRSASWESS